MSITVEIETVGRADRIALRFAYDEQLVVRAKRISGSRWSPEFRCWHYPLDLSVCRLLRTEFPSLLIGPRLTAWARTEVARRSSLKDFHAATSAEPVQLEIGPVEAPTAWSAMLERGYQTLVPAFAKSVGSHFNGSQPGCGKTIETLASLVECRVGRLVLVVAPRKAIQSTWPREINRWLAPDMAVGIHVVDNNVGTIPVREERLVEILSSRPSEERFTFILINPEMLRWEFSCPDQKCNGKRTTCGHRKEHTKAPQHPSLFKVAWDSIIMDETHKIMMNANERSANVSGWGYGAQKLRTTEGAMKIGLSGTPFKGKPRRFWTMLHWLRKDLYNGRGKWEAQYFEMDDSYSPFTAYARPTEVMRADREKLFNDDLSAIMIRHTKRELRKINPAWAPPEKIHVDIRLPIEGRQAANYRSMVNDASARLDGGTLTANGVLAEMTRLKQFASSSGKLAQGGKFLPSLPSNKWEWILEALEERGLARGMNDGDVKIGIASQYVELLEMFSAELTRLGINHFTITGKSKETQRVEEEWQSDQTHTRVLLLSTMSGVSLTLDAADDLIEVDETFVPDDQEQVEDRFHRTSRTDHQVTVYHLQTEGTIDAIIAADNLSADTRQKIVLDGRRGIDFARHVLQDTGGGK